MIEGRSELGVKQGGCVKAGGCVRVGFRLLRG